jgi:hypothetical protein
VVRRRTYMLQPSAYELTAVRECRTLPRMLHRTLLGSGALLVSCLLAACGSEDSGVEFKASATTGAGATGAGGSSSGPSSGGAQSGPSSGSGTGNEGAGAGGASSTSTGSGGGAPGATVRLLAFGDTGEGNTAQHEVADRMSEKCGTVGGCDAALLLGDNFYDHGVQSTSDPLWLEYFEEPYDRPGLNGIPFYVVLGNHDHGPTSTGNRQAQIDYSYLPVGNGPGMRYSDKWTMPFGWYDVQIGDVHIFAIDTVSFTDDQQQSDMAAKVAASTAIWKIVIGHHPRFTSGEHYWDNQLLGAAGLFAFQKAIYCGADMFLTGHDHNRELIDKGRDGDCPNTHFVVSGSGAKTRESFDFTPTDDKQLFYDEMTEGYLYLELTGNTMLFQFIDRTGAVSFSKMITK